MRTGWKYNNLLGVYVVVFDAPRLCADARWSGERGKCGEEMINSQVAIFADQLVKVQPLKSAV